MNIIEHPENRLETLLRLAESEPAHRPEFCKRLLESNVFVLGEAEDDEGVGEFMEESSTVALVSWQEGDGSETIPFFSSLETMQDSIEGDENYVELPARVLFEMTLGSKLVLNPHSEYGKDFYPDEINSLLASGILHESSQQIIESEGEVLMGQPEENPSQLIDSLTTLFSKHANVKAAYLALIQDRDEGEEANLIIGIQGKGDLETVIQEAGLVAWDATEGNETIDFMVIEDDDDPISGYFLNECKPFYEGRWGTKLDSNVKPGEA